MNYSQQQQMECRAAVGLLASTTVHATQALVDLYDQKIAQGMTPLEALAGVEAAILRKS